MSAHFRSPARVGRPGQLVAPPGARRTGSRCRAAAVRRRAGQGAQPLFGAPLPDRRGAVRQFHQGNRHQDQPRRCRRRRHPGAAEERRHRRARPTSCCWSTQHACGVPKPTGCSSRSSRSCSSRGFPAKLRADETADGIAWFGLSTRARVIVYNKATVDKADVHTYESLADPKNKGKLCTRSGSHPYNLSLFGSMMEHLGEAGNRNLAEGHGRQHGARPERRRYRSDQGGCQRRMPDCADQQLLPGAADALEQARRSRGDR